MEDDDFGYGGPGADPLPDIPGGTSSDEDDAVASGPYSHETRPRASVPASSRFARGTAGYCGD
jgi:hypothetical protein